MSSLSRAHATRRTGWNYLAGLPEWLPDGIRSHPPETSFCGVRNWRFCASVAQGRVFKLSRNRICRAVDGTVAGGTSSNPPVRAALSSPGRKGTKPRVGLPLAGSRCLSAVNLHHPGARGSVAGNSRRQPVLELCSHIKGGPQQIVVGRDHAFGDRGGREVRLRVDPNTHRDF